MEDQCMNCGKKLPFHNFDESWCSDECYEEWRANMEAIAEERYYNPDAFEDSPCVEQRIRPSQY